MTQKTQEQIQQFIAEWADRVVNPANPTEFKYVLKDQLVCRRRCNIRVTAAGWLDTTNNRLLPPGPDYSVR